MIRPLVRCVLLLCVLSRPSFFSFFFFNDTATTEIYTLSLHDALPIWDQQPVRGVVGAQREGVDASLGLPLRQTAPQIMRRSEEHTSELQSRLHLVCRLLLEKKKQNEFSRSVSLATRSPPASRHTTIHP